MRPFRRVPALLLLAGLSAPLGAQVLQPRQPSWTDKWNFGIGLFGGLPMGDFKDHEDGGGGLDLTLGFQPFRRQPMSIRGTMTFMDYGGLRQHGQQQVCDQFGTCWFEDVEFDARNHTMMTFQGGIEFMATDGKWRPFTYALAGTTVFNSTAAITATGPTGPDQDTESFFTSSNFSQSYGVGLRRVGTRWGRETGFELTTRFTRNVGATFITEDGIEQQSDGTWVATPRSGAANVLGIHIGFWIGPYITIGERR